MKHKIILFLIFCNSIIYAQNDVYVFKDVKNEYSINTIENANFTRVEKSVSEKHSDASYWFKIPATKSNENYVFRINSIRIKTFSAFQNQKKIQKNANERYLAYRFNRNSPVYFRVNSDFIAYYPFDLNTEDDSVYKEKIQIIMNSFYYGFTFLVIIYCFFNFYFFRDKAFLYFALLISSLTLGFFLLDGMFHFFKVSHEIEAIIYSLNYIFLAFFSSKFVHSFLLLDDYFPNLKKYTYTLGFLIIINAILFLFYTINLLFIILNILVFTILVIYWLSGVLLFKNNVYTKIFVFSYATLLFSGIDFLVLKNLGIQIFETNPQNMKIGGLIQIIVISVSVLYREKTLRTSNQFMKSEIIKYSKEIEQIETETKDDISADILQTLSSREKEIFDLIITGNSNKLIADSLNISVNTVKFHVKNIYEKLHIKSRKEAITLEKSFN